MEDKRECILVVDDSQINRDILKGILKNDYRVLETENGLEALNLLDIESTSVSAILLDIMVLEQTARILMQNIREQDRVVRMGGDDFLVILMGCGQAEAAAKAEEFRKEAGKLPYSVHDSGYIRLEAGISSRDHFDQNPSTLKQMIDEATADRNQADRTAV